MTTLPKQTIRRQTPARPRLRQLFAAAATLTLLPACSLFGSFTEPAPEEPIQLDEAYLKGGPSTDIELGAGERTLLEDYKKLDDTRIQLETRLGEMQVENQQIRTLLGQTEQERDRERQARVGAEKEFERMAQRGRDLEAKVLSLSIQNSKLEQETLQLRIASLERELRQLSAVADEPAARPAPAGGR